MSEKFLPMDQAETAQAGHSTRSGYSGQDVFLSHSGIQKNFVRQLFEDLKNQGVSCFFDEDSESLPKAEKFPPIIFERAETCKIAVLLLSKDFLETKWPMLELAAFVKARYKTRTNPNPKILPLFFLISPNYLNDIKTDNEKWKQLGISGEMQVEWLEALKEIRRTNGMIFEERGNEVEFRKKIVEEIRRILPPSAWYHIPSMQGGERMCQEVTNFFNSVVPNEKGIVIAGLYGIAGHGKTSLGKAFCNHKLIDFEGKVCHLEFSKGDSLERMKLALQYLFRRPQSHLQTLTEDQAKVELYERLKDQKVLLVLDNVTDKSMDEVSYYIKADTRRNSYILLSVRSVDLLVNHFRIPSPSCMHVPRLEEDDAIAILLESTSLEVSTLGSEDKASASKCANRCSFSCDFDRRRRTFHPLALKAFGRQLFYKYGENLSKWVAEVDGLENPCGYGLDAVFGVLLEAFNDMFPECRTIFMLLTIYMLPNMSPHEVTMWLAIICNEEISSINQKVEDLRKKAFIEEFEPEIRIHDLYIEFAQSTANEMRKWLWWKGDRNSTRQLISKDQEGFELAKLECTSRRPSQISPKFLRYLCLFQLVGVHNMNKIDFRQMDSLRSVTLQNCKDLTELEGMENLLYLAWLQISEVNPMFNLPELSSLEGLQHLLIDIAVTQVLVQLRDLNRCSNLREISVRCPSLPEFPRLNGLTHLEKVEFSACGEVKGALDCTDCEMLQSIVLNGCCKMAASPVLAGCKVLENLHLWNMGELKELPNFNHLSNLTVLNIGKCGVREAQHLTCCVKLEKVYFFTLKNLESFPNFSLLKELKILSLYNCRRVQDPPDISGCHKLQVFHLFCNDNVKGLPEMHECPELDEIKVSWHCKEEVTYEGIDPDSCEVDDNFQSCVEHFKGEIPVENLDDVSVPIELREWLSMQEKCWMAGRTLLAKKYFRGVKLYCSVTASYVLYESSNYYSKNYITLRLVDSKVIAFPTPGRVSKDRDWLNEVREYFAGKKDIVRASAAQESENVEPISLRMPRYHVSAMQGEARMCQEVAELFNAVHPNERGIRIAGLYGMSGSGKTTLGKAFCNLKMEDYESKVFHIDLSGGSAMDRQKLPLQYLTHSRKQHFEWVTGEDDVRYLFRTIMEGHRVLLVLDNIRENSIHKVRDYLGADVGEGSCVLLIARSKHVLLKNFKIDSMSCKRIPGLKEEEALPILLERTPAEVSALKTHKESMFKKRMLALAIQDRGETSFLREPFLLRSHPLAREYRRETSFLREPILLRYHPLALKALGRYLFSKHVSDLSKWAAGKIHLDVFAVLREAFDHMDRKSQSIFKLLTLLISSKTYSDEVIKWVAENCKEEVKDLYDSAFIEEIEPEIRMDDLMEEFVETLEERRWPGIKAGRWLGDYGYAPFPPSYGVPAIQGEKLANFFNTVRPNKNRIRIAGLYGMPGQGKTTLAKEFCNRYLDDFDWKVCYLQVCGGNTLERRKIALQYLARCSQSELESLTSENEAQVVFNEKVKWKRVLLVLDNIETAESIDEVRDYLGVDLGQGSCILLIARSVDFLRKNFNVNSESCMVIPSLTEEEAIPILLEKASVEESALSRFCQYAFGIPTNPSHPHLDKELVQAECRGLPPAVQEIVNSIYGRSSCEGAKNMPSEGEPLGDYHKDGPFNRLKTSIGALDDGEKQCFLDLVAFPLRRCNPANALLDIWVYVRGMKRDKAAVLLLKFAALHLLHLRRDNRLATVRDDRMDSYTFLQDDIGRNLALFLAEHDNRNHFRRIYPTMQSDFYPVWQPDRCQSSEAQIVSIYTGAMTDTQWPQMDFPEVEALVLYFNASENSIPPFLFKMEKLKILIIRCGRPGNSRGLDNFQEPSQTKTLHLDNFQVPSLVKTLHLDNFDFPSRPENGRVFESLEKIHLRYCKGPGLLEMFNFPGLLECYLESCKDLTELPAGICSSKSLEVLSLTDCDRLIKLPDELGKLSSLKEIRLHKCFSLTALPPAICKLTKLEILDISHTGLDLQVEENLQKLAKLPSLKCLICSQITKQLFESISRPGLEVVVDRGHYW